MKLSFSITSKPSSSSRPPTSNPPESFNPNRDLVVDDDAASKPQFVTVFDSSKKSSSSASTKIIIPPIPNADIWSRVKNKYLPLPTDDDNPSSESLFVLDSTGNGSNEPGANRYGLLLRSNVSEERKYYMSDKQAQFKSRFQEDMDDLLDDELPDVPVEGFGSAILAGYGWEPGKEDVKFFEYKPRAGTSGLGYVPQVPSAGMRSQKEEIAAGFKSVNEKNAVIVSRDERKSENRERKKRRRNEDERHDERSREEKKNNFHETPSDGKNTSDEKTPMRWLRSHIRVKIISKRFCGGKLYLKKGEVMDVVGPTTCDIRIDGSKELLQGVNQEILETALPEIGGSVLVLYGEHKGVFGSLVEKDYEKDRGLVKEADNHSFIKKIRDAKQMATPLTMTSLIKLMTLQGEATITCGL